MDIQANEWMDRWTNRRTERELNRQMNRWTDGWMSDRKIDGKADWKMNRQKDWTGQAEEQKRNIQMTDICTDGWIDRKM